MILKHKELQIIYLLNAMIISVLSGHRTVAPPGLLGGGSGKVGSTSLLRTNGSVEILKYADQVEGQKGDILVGISTSGNSINVVKAIEKANDLGITTIGLTGNHGGKMADICDLIIKIPSNDTPRIQEGHILIGHIICQLIEEELFSDA